MASADVGGGDPRAPVPGTGAISDVCREPRLGREETKQKKRFEANDRVLARLAPPEATGGGGSAGVIAAARDRHAPAP